jgi:hypothetical protein
VGLGELRRRDFRQHGFAVEQHDAALVGLVRSELPIGLGLKRFDIGNLLDRHVFASDGDNVLHGRVLGKVLRDGNSRTVRRSGGVLRGERVAMLGRGREAARRKGTVAIVGEAGSALDGEKDRASETFNLFREHHDATIRVSRGEGTRRGF